MTKPLARRAWIEACRFQEADEAVAIEAAFARVTESAKAGHRPVALLDVDSSLYDTGPRTRRIVDDWIAEGNAPKAIQRAFEDYSHDARTF